MHSDFQIFGQGITCVCTPSATPRTSPQIGDTVLVKSVNQGWILATVSKLDGDDLVIQLHPPQGEEVQVILSRSQIAAVVLS